MSVSETLTNNTALDDVSINSVSRYGPIVGLVGLYVYFTLATDRFLTVGNQLNLLEQVSIIGILATGMTFVIICAEIDLSIAQMLEFIGLLIAGLATGTVLGQSLPVPIAVLGGFAAAIALGGISGYITARFDVPSFMTTLAMLFLADGLGQFVSNNRPIGGLPESLVWLGSEATFGIPNIALTFLVLLAISQFVLSYTRYGLYIYAVGDNREAAERMGINITVMRLSVLVLMAVFTVVGAIVTMGRISIATPNMGANFLLPPIAAVILGGADLFGGSGNMIGTLIGVLILGALSNGLNLLGVDPAGQLMAQGIVLMIAVLVNVVGRD